MTTIPLYNKQEDIVDYAIVDEKLLHLFIAGKWNKTYHGYATRGFGDNKVWMHRFVYEKVHGSIKEKLPIDHINRNKLDNRIENLRQVTHQLNTLNHSRNPNITTGYFGVRLDKRTSRYQAYAKDERGWRSIGYFDLSEDAALAHDLVMKNRFPNEILTLNFKNPDDSHVKKVLLLIANAKKRKGKSKYRGLVHFPDRKKCWNVRIAKDGIDYQNGYYESEEEAALAYNEIAIRIYGSKAILNQIIN